MKERVPGPSQLRSSVHDFTTHESSAAKETVLVTEKDSARDEKTSSSTSDFSMSWFTSYFISWYLSYEDTTTEIPRASKFQSNGLPCILQSRQTVPVPKLCNTYLLLPCRHSVTCSPATSLLPCHTQPRNVLLCYVPHSATP
jgi:hypothetical protein